MLSKCVFISSRNGQKYFPRIPLKSYFPYFSAHEKYNPLVKRFVQMNIFMTKMEENGKPWIKVTPYFPIWFLGGISCICLFWISEQILSNADHLKSNASSALCHTSTICGFVVSGNSIAMWFLLCLEILHFDWLVNCICPMVLVLGEYTPQGALHAYTQDRLDKSCSGRRSVTKYVTVALFTSWCNLFYSERIKAFYDNDIAYNS